MKLPDLVVATPDVGGIRMAPRVRGMAGRRPRRRGQAAHLPEEAEAGFVIGDVKGKNVLLVDDMITTGGSLSNAALALRDYGAREIYAAAAHAVLCGPAVERLNASALKEIVVSDSIPVGDKVQQLGGRLKVAHDQQAPRRGRPPHPYQRIGQFTVHEPLRSAA